MSDMLWVSETVDVYVCVYALYGAHTNDHLRVYRRHSLS